jgi:hypothetical protein
MIRSLIVVFAIPTLLSIMSGCYFPEKLVTKEYRAPTTKVLLVGTLDSLKQEKEFAELLGPPYQAVSVVKNGKLVEHRWLYKNIELSEGEDRRSLTDLTVAFDPNHGKLRQDFSDMIKTPLQ